MKSQEWKRIKREGAESRKVEHDKLTPQQKLDQIIKHGFTAKRERARLEKVIRDASMAQSGAVSTNKADDAKAQVAQKEKARKHNLELAEKKQKITKPENVITIPAPKK